MGTLVCIPGGSGGNSNGYVTKPTFSNAGPYTYNGKDQGPTVTIDDFIKNNVSVSGTRTAKDPGNYTITVSLRNTKHYRWVGGGTDPITKTYTINKAAGTLTLSATSVTLNKDTTSTVITCSGYTGAISASSSDTSKVTVSVSGANVTIKSATTNSTTATVSITAAGDATHAAVTKNVSVTLAFQIKKKFSEATDSEIVQMVADANAGKLDLVNDCGWAVGQTHTTTLPAIAASGTYSGQKWTVGESQPSQQITLVLMDTGSNSGYRFTNPTASNLNQGSYVHFVVGLKNALKNSGYLIYQQNPDAPPGVDAYWSGYARRNWCNGGFRQAIESILPGVFKQFDLQYEGYDDTFEESSMMYESEYFALFAAKEVLGNASNSSRVYTYNEASRSNLKQIRWYATSSNRIKKFSDSGSNCGWWTRSLGHDGYYCIDIDTSGRANTDSPGTYYGISPFGCL